MSVPLINDFEQSAEIYEDVDLSGLFDPKLGFSVIPIPSAIIDSFDLNTFLSEQVEYVHSDPNQLFVLGGFGALGNPSSFHHPLRREFMRKIYQFVAPAISYAYSFEWFFYSAGKQDKTPYSYLSMVPDRFAIRRSDQEVTPEAWHKDRSLNLNQSKDAFMLGGWVNLDKDKVQTFSCIPGEFPLFNQTHSFYASQLNVDVGGFKKEVLSEETLSRQVEVEIPPYHMIIFNELVTHEVAKGEKKRKFDASQTSYRCFVKWYISKKDTPYWSAERFSNFIEDQTQIGMSYFQPDAPMYASAHTSTSISKLTTFSDQFKPEVKNFVFKDSTKYPGVFLDRFIGQGNATKPNINAKRLGLRDWDLAFEEYSNADIEIYFPRRMI
jgi:hypothetical protein